MKVLVLVVGILVVAGFLAAALESFFGVDVSDFLRVLAWPVYLVLAFVFCFGVWGFFRWLRGK